MVNCAKLAQVSDLIEQSAVELSTALRRGDLSPTEVVTAHLDRIDEVNDRVNAIVALRSRQDVLADAAALDGKPAVGPLHGLPVAVKDLQDVAGLPTSYGSVVGSDQPVGADGHVAQRLRAAGAIIVGKTNTPEFGTGCHTFNEVYGLTRNPWNLDRSAGGSSGGAAAALAARMLPIADGSDLGGSLRNPAGFCGVVGLRPSIGMVASPDTKSTHLVRLGLEGPMARNVADTALLMSALASEDNNDPLSLHPYRDRFADELPATTTARLAWAGDTGQFVVEPEVLQIAEGAARRVVDAGGTFGTGCPDLSDSMMVFRTLRGLAYRGLGNDMPDQVERMKGTVQENIAYGRSLTVEDVLAAERARAVLHRRMTKFFEEFDVLALPTAQVAPFPAEWEFPTEVAGQKMPDYLGWMTAACIITPTGCPAISIPAGFTADGLPVGLQLVGRVGHDRQLLEVAAAIEAASPSALRSAPAL